MKRDVFAMLADLPQKIVDENSLSIAEISAHAGISQNSALRHARKNVASGKWEQVWKRGSRVLVPSYRKAKQ